jgi:hypothetical protein
MQQSSNNLEEVASTLPNYKMVDSKYYIKTTKLGKGNFAETYCIFCIG